MAITINFDQAYTDNVIESMWSRIELTLNCGGQSIKR